MVNAQGVWSEKQKKFLSTLSAQDDIPSPNTSKFTTVADEDDDPDEIDISEIPSTEPKDDFMQQREIMMRQMMGQSPDSMGDAQDPFGILRQMQAMQTNRAGGNAGGQEQVPMNPFAMLQQMQASANAGGPGTVTGDPFSMMNELLQGAAIPNGSLPNPGQQQQQQQQGQDSRDGLWRTIHVASIVLLLSLLDRPSFPSIYSSSTSTYQTSAVFRGRGQPVFWWFITLELVLQSTRLFLHGPTLQRSLLANVAPFLPPPYSARLALLSRYASVFSTLRDDFWVLLFGLGLVAWWNAS